MLHSIIPKLPMRNKQITQDYYIQQLDFTIVGGNFTDYLMLAKEGIELHFFLFEQLDIASNYGQVYIRTQGIDTLYAQLLQNQVAIHPNGSLANKPWKQKEFSLLDPDNNLLTFGENL